MTKSERSLNTDSPIRKAKANQQQSRSKAKANAKMKQKQGKSKAKQRQSRGKRLVFANEPRVVTKLLELDLCSPKESIRSLKLLYKINRLHNWLGRQV